MQKVIVIPKPWGTSFLPSTIFCLCQGNTLLSLLYVLMDKFTTQCCGFGCSAVRAPPPPVAAGEVFVLDTVDLVRWFQPVVVT